MKTRMNILTLACALTCCRHRTDDDSARHQVAAQRGQGAAGGNAGWT